MRHNPYEFPESGGTDIINPTTYVRPPAIILMVLAVIALLLDVPIDWIPIRKMRGYRFPRSNAFTRFHPWDPIRNLGACCTVRARSAKCVYREGVKQTFSHAE